MISISRKLAKTPTQKPKFSIDIKNTNGQSVTLADPRATRALVALMNQHATIGGAACHWGGPAAFAEMMSAIHGIMFSEQSREWFDAYNFVNDAGHAENGIYALRSLYAFDHLSFEDLKKFRSIESKLTGHGEAHLNPEGVLISNGPLGSGVPQAQGLAIADKLLGNTRTTICVLSDGGAMEGEAKEALAAIPGLAAKNKLNPFLLVISDNNTKLGGRIDKDSFSMKPSFDSLAQQGWNCVHVEDGHNLEAVYQSIEKALETLKNQNTPIALIIKTIKGFGVKSTMESASGGHGYPLKAYDEKLIDFIQEIYQGHAPEEFVQWAKEILNSRPAPKTSSSSPIKSEKVQDGFARAMIKAAQDGFPVFSVSSDLQSSTGAKGFQTAFPDKFLDVGIAESNMVSVAVGLSLNGFIPVVDTFAQFGVTKGNLPLVMAGLSQGPVIALFSHTGFQDAADGASHQATHYFSALSSIPHLKVFNPSCSKEAEYLMYEAIKSFAEARKNNRTPDSVIFFLGRENHPEHYGIDQFQYGKAQVLTKGTAATVYACGTLLQEALKAAEVLKEKGKPITVINAGFINYPDTETIATALKETQMNLITIEDHQLIGGMGAMLTHALCLSGIKPNLKSLGIKGEFGQSAYQAMHLYQRHQLDAQSIVNAVLSF